jgi:hypothetical protein
LPVTSSPDARSVDPSADTLAANGNVPSRPANASLRSRRSRYIGYENEKASSPSLHVCPCFGPGERNRTSSRGSRTGSSRSITRSTRAKIAALAPMPSASVAIAAVAKAGLRKRPRRAYRKSWRRAFIIRS